MYYHNSRMAEVALGHTEELTSYSLSKNFTALSYKPTLYEVLQELGTRLLPLLSKSNQSERSVKWQLAQESIRGGNMLSNLKRTKTKERESHLLFFFTVQYPSSTCIPPCKKCPLDTKTMIMLKCQEKGNSVELWAGSELFHRHNTLSEFITLMCCPISLHLGIKGTKSKRSLTVH